MEIIPNLKEVKFIIDTNNVCYTSQGVPLLHNLILIYEYLIKELNVKAENVYCICDPNLQFIIDDVKKFNELTRNGTIFIAPKSADEFILLLAQKFSFCFIISNDKYRQYYDQLPDKQWLKQRKVSFMIIKNQVCLSPDIEYDNLVNLRSDEKEEIRTTLDVISDIEDDNRDSDWDLYSN